MKNPPLALTVDVESDWGSAELHGVTTVLPRFLELLDRYGAHATFFVVGAVAPAFRAHVPPSSPHEIGSHGLTHRLLTQLTRAEQLHEITESKRVLEALGYAVAGFRAPFLRRPRGLRAMLASAGYAYDSSDGSVVPSLDNLLGPARRRARGVVRRLPPSTLRDGLTPFSLTWLRIYQPIAHWLIPNRRAVFYCHLHEFLDASPGWPSLIRPLRALHARNTGAAAWGIFEEHLARRRQLLSCREYLASQ